MYTFDPSDKELPHAYNYLILSTGWVRFLPHLSHDILWIIALDAALTPENIPVALDELGIDCKELWESDTQMTKSEKETLERKKELFALLASRYSTPVPTTVLEMVDFLIKAHFVTQSPSTKTLALASNVCLPGEILPLSKEEIRFEDYQRWSYLYTPISAKIKNLFFPRTLRHSELQFTIAHLSTHLNCDHETIRSALELFLEEPYASSSVVIETLKINDSFSLHIDWKIFDQVHFVQ